MSDLIPTPTEVPVKKAPTQVDITAPESQANLAKHAEMMANWRPAPTVPRYEWMEPSQRELLSASCNKAVNFLRSIVSPDEILGTTRNALFREDSVYSLAFLFSDKELLADILNTIQAKKGLDGILDVEHNLVLLLEELLEVLKTIPNTTLFPDNIVQALNYIPNHPTQTLTQLKATYMPGYKAFAERDTETAVESVPDEVNFEEP